MAEGKIDLWFAIPFSKGVVGVENDTFTAAFEPACKDCEKDLHKGVVYYYYEFDQNADIAPSIEDDNCYCKKCAKKRMKVKK